MALTSRAQAGPGYARASQTPFAIGPGGGASFGDLLSRQFALREQMQQAQLAQMKQDLLFQKQNQMRQGDIYGKSRMVQGGLTAGPGMDPTRAKAYDMARELSRTSIGSLAVTPNLERMISAIGGPQVAHEGMMQSGRILGQLGSQAMGAGAQMDSNRMRAEAEAMRYGVPPESGGRSGSTFQPYAAPPVGAAPFPMWGQAPHLGPRYGTPMPKPGSPGTPGSLEKGGRVPATGTYKLHKGEVVVSRKASDVMFPYVGGGPPKSKGKPRKSYRDGTIEFLKNFKLPENMTKKEALDIIKFLKSYTPPPPQYSAGGGEMGLNLAGDPGPGVQGFGGFQGGGFGGTGAGASFDTPAMIPETAARSFMMGGDEERAAQGMEALRNVAGAALLPGTQPRTEEENAAIMEQARQIEQANAAALAQSNEALVPPQQAPSAFTPGLQAPESAGTISYAGPGIGGMTKFGVEGATGPFETMQVAQGSDIVDMHRMENEATIADRSAQIAEQRGDKLERYLNEQSTPNRELVAMIKENDRAAQRWRKRSTELRAQADKTKSIQVAKQLQTIEARGVSEAARYKAMGEAGKDQLQNFDANFESMQSQIDAAYKNLEADSNEERFRAAIMRAFAPLLGQLKIRHPEGHPKAGQIMDANEMAAWFDDFTLRLSDYEDRAGQYELPQLISNLARGRLG